MSDPPILVAGETLVDFLPDEPGSLASVESFDRRPGGAPANVAVGLARLGHPPAFWTRVGDDPFGDYLRGVLQEHGVPETYVERDGAAETALAFVSLDSAADREFSLYVEHSASAHLKPGRIDDSTLEATEWLHVGGVCLAFDPARAALVDLLERAAERDVTVSVDPNARPELWREYDYAETLLTALPLVDVLKVSVDDLEPAGFDGPTDEVVDALHDRGPHTVLLTRGADGATVSATERAPWGPAMDSHDGYNVDAADATGAGDAFAAAAIAGFADGRSVAAVTDFANAVAAMTTTEPGAMTALPTRRAVSQFRERRSR